MIKIAAIGLLMGLADFFGLYRLSNPKTIDELVKVANTPDKVSDWVTNRVWYDEKEKDGSLDYWQTGNETLERGKGDCDDYAILYRDALRKMGYPAEFVVVDTPKGSHAVTAYQDKDTWRLMDCTNGLSKKTGKSVEELLKNAQPSYKIQKEYPIDEDLPSKEYLEVRAKLNNWTKGG